MAVSEHLLLLPHKLSKAVVTSAAAKVLLELGPNDEVAEMSAVVQAVKLASLSSVVKKDVQFGLIPVGII